MRNSHFSEYLSPCHFKVILKLFSELLAFSQLMTHPQDPNIDPALYSGGEDSDDDDPTLRFCTIHPQNTEGGPSNTGGVDDQEDSTLEVDNFSVANDPPQYPPPRALGPVPNLLAFARLVKHTKKFSDSADADFDSYCMVYLRLTFLSFLNSIPQNNDIEERLALQYALSLENRDLLRTLVKPESWVLSDELKVRFLSRHYCSY